MKKIILALILCLLPLKPLLAIDTEFQCLVRNVYYESRGEPRNGKLAVALVTLNRTENPKYPKSICDVVYQKKQFSWTIKFKKTKIDEKAWQESKDAAMQAYMDRGVLGVFPATHFHATYVSPNWRMRRITKIGKHIFYA